MTKTYAQIAREIAALQATASKLYAIETQGAVAKVNELIAKYGLSADHLKFGAASAAPAPVAKAASAAPTAASGAKYSDGQGRVWGGRGPRPAWLRSAIAAGRSLESFLAAGAADVVAALTKSVGGSAKKSVVKKPAATGVAKYVNPKTGTGWSGRGPRPQWLKDALKKRGSKIEDFLGNKPASTDAAISPAAPAPVAPAKKVAAKKVVAKKVAAKKAAAKKVTANAVAAPAAPAPVAPAKKAAAKKASAKVATKKAAKAPAKTAAVAPAKKAVVTQAAAKSAPAAPAKKAAAKKATAPAKKAPAKKAAVASVAPAMPAVASATEAPATAADA